MRATRTLAVALAITALCLPATAQQPAQPPATAQQAEPAKPAVELKTRTRSARSGIVMRDMPCAPAEKAPARSPTDGAPSTIATTEWLLLHRPRLLLRLSHPQEVATLPATAIGMPGVRSARCDLMLVSGRAPRPGRAAETADEWTGAGRSHGQDYLAK